MSNVQKDYIVGNGPREKPVRGEASIAGSGITVRIPPAVIGTAKKNEKAPSLELDYLAEEVGFEPTLPGIPVKQFSRLPPSTTRPPLRIRLSEASLTWFVCRCRLEKVAERQGFEPWIRFWRIHDFQSCSFGQLGHLSASPRCPHKTHALSRRECEQICSIA